MSTGANRKKRSQTAPGAVQAAVVRAWRPRTPARSFSPSATSPGGSTPTTCSASAISSTRRPAGRPSGSEEPDILLLPGQSHASSFPPLELGVPVTGDLRDQAPPAGRHMELDEVAEVLDDLDLAHDLVRLVRSRLMLVHLHGRRAHRNRPRRPGGEVALRRERAQLGGAAVDQDAAAFLRGERTLEDVVVAHERGHADV